MMNISTMSEFEESGSLFGQGWFSQQKWEHVHKGFQRRISLDSSQNLFGRPSSNNSAYISQDQSKSLVEDYPPEPESTRDEPAPPRRYPIDYQKNICAYITKKAVQCFLSLTYKQTIERLCKKHGCQLSEVLTYYRNKNRDVFGITHLWLLVTPQSEEEVPLKKVFTTFFQWFLRERYLIYLLKFGKMSDKQKYIEFKNKYLLYIGHMSTQSLQRD